MRMLFNEKKISARKRYLPDASPTRIIEPILRKPSRKLSNRRKLLSSIAVLAAFCLGLVPLKGGMPQAGGFHSASPALLESNNEGGIVALQSTGKPAVVKPFCTDFNDNSLHGWAPCTIGQQVNILLDKPGPSGNQTDIYLRAEDLSGPSVVCASPDYRGDWTELASAGCSSLCFDLIILEDGDSNNHTNITPSVVLVSDPDGTGSMPPLRAHFKANFTVSEGQGSNPGWHTICAPLAPLSGGNLPSNASGAWSMLDSKPNSDWTNLLANVTDVQLPIDFTSNPAEIVGYDNICIKRQSCACVEVKTTDVHCKPDSSGGFTYSFEVTNHSGSPVNSILLTPASGSSFTFTQQQFILSSPLFNGQMTSLTVGVNGATSGQEICFLVTLTDAELKLCGCSARVCLKLPACDCVHFIKEEVVKGPNGTFIYTFTIVNANAFPLANLYLSAPSGITINPSYFAVNIAPNGGQFTGSVTIMGAGGNSQVCLNIGFYDSQMNNCCRLKPHCIKLK